MYPNGSDVGGNIQSSEPEPRNNAVQPVQSGKASLRSLSLMLCVQVKVKGSKYSYSGWMILSAHHAGWQHPNFIGRCLSTADVKIETPSPSHPMRMTDRSSVSSNTRSPPVPTLYPRNATAPKDTGVSAARHLGDIVHQGASVMGTSRWQWSSGHKSKRDHKHGMTDGQGDKLRQGGRDGERESERWSEIVRRIERKRDFMLKCLMLWKTNIQPPYDNYIVNVNGEEVDWKHKISAALSVS